MSVSDVVDDIVEVDVSRMRRLWWWRRIRRQDWMRCLIVSSELLRPSKAGTIHEGACRVK